mmetsp:Transcript_1707/g.6871  ORF Transcript_1707/g.6871 Transcript_1707/m.6871 type:complete len:235 (-) Transcript_1707:498-1202(-)
MACFCVLVLASVPNPPSRASPVQSPLAPSPNPSVLLHNSASPPSWCCSCAITLFWSRIVRSLRRSSSASAKALGVSSYERGEPPSSLLKRPSASKTKTRTSCRPAASLGSGAENPALGEDAGLRPQTRPMFLSPRGTDARDVRTRNPSTYTETEEGGAAPLSHAQPCTTPRATPSTCPSKNGSSFSVSVSPASFRRASFKREPSLSVERRSSVGPTIVALASSVKRGRPARDAS